MGVGVREGVVDCPGGGEEVAASVGGGAEGLEGEDVGECVCMEGLGWGLAWRGA